MPGILRLTVALAAAVLVALPSGARAADVHGDDGGDRYVGTGGLVLPRTIPDPTRREIAECGDCQWRLSTPCMQQAEDGLGRPFDGQPACESVTRGCPVGELLRVWFRGHGEGWRSLGLICQQAGGPVTVRQVAGEVATEVERRVPPLDPRTQPATGILAQIPVRFSSGQSSGVHRWPLEVQGASVDIAATPQWSWTFGDGAVLRTPLAEGPEVAHAYRRASGFAVSCTTTWSATFTVAGLGPFPVPEPVTQQARLPVRVSEGRALLTPVDASGR